MSNVVTMSRGALIWVGIYHRAMALIRKRMAEAEASSDAREETRLMRVYLRIQRRLGRAEGRLREGA
jgi:hypothetical protein